MNRPDVIGGAAWIAFGAAVCLGAWHMERFDTMGATLYTMPGFMPGLIGALLVVLGGALAWRGVRGGATGTGAPAREPLFTTRVLAMLALCLAYAAGLVGRVPFWLATALFVAAFTYAFTPPETARTRRVLGAVAAGALTSLAVVLVFEQVFLVRLP
jgi:hypothetical protein